MEKQIYPQTVSHGRDKLSRYGVGFENPNTFKSDPFDVNNLTPYFNDHKFLFCSNK